MFQEGLMGERRAASNLGIYFYGAGAIALGVSGLVWRDFAINWQRVGPNVPHREALAILAAVYEVAAGVAIAWRRTRRAGAAMLTVLYAIFTLLWVVQAVRAPRVYDGWGNVFEELSLVIAGMVVYAWAAPPDSAWATQRKWISRAYGICPISFGADHFIYLSAAAGFVPKWIPPGQMFWVVATAVCFLLAAAAILSGILAGLAARMLTVMIVGFGILGWLPRLFGAPHMHFMWSANAINLALAGAVWVVADAIRRSEQPLSW
jgi:uncharacterized membrane protein YphA (DoxX/SURF4 family)